MQKVVIIGGGLAGLSAALYLATRGRHVSIIEKKQYPFHRVCGEYLSREVLPYLSQFNVELEDNSNANLNYFHLSDIKGKSLKMPLDLGGIGISRYKLDHILYEKALSVGVEFIFDEVRAIERESSHYNLTLKKGLSISSPYLVGAYGKLSRLDTERPYFSRPRPYMGIKYHIKRGTDRESVSLHNFEGGYAGVNAIEGDSHNFCYLIRREVVKRYGGIEGAEKSVMKKNPQLKEIFDNSDFLWDKPLAINSFRFDIKEPVVNGMLMTGDASGLIVPLSGNGMALAIHQGKIAAENLDDYFGQPADDIAALYTAKWTKLFKNRYRFSNRVQWLFGNKSTSSIAIWLGRKIYPVAKAIMKKTHGQPF